VRRTYKVTIRNPVRHRIYIPRARVGEPCAVLLVLQNGMADDRIAWNAAVPGLTRSEDGYFLEGIPEREGTYELAYQLTTSSGRTERGTATLRVLPPHQPLSLGSGAIQTWVGESARFLVPYRGGIEPVSIWALDPLPEGLRLEEGVILGIPVRAALTVVRLRAMDSAGDSTSSDMAVRVGTRF
jgi:hypothetical protein